MFQAFKAFIQQQNKVLLFAILLSLMLVCDYIYSLQTGMWWAPPVESSLGIGFIVVKLILLVVASFRYSPLTSYSRMFCYWGLGVYFLLSVF